MVPRGMVVTVGTTGGIVVVGMGASVADRALELLVGGGVAGATTAGGGGVTGGRAMSTCSALALSVGTASAGGVC